jgi:Ca-activated chloride channel family protein
MGAGHQVIVVYEIVMADAPFEIGGDALKYQEDSAGVENGEWLTIALRYKDPGAPVSKGIEYTLDESAYTTEPDADWIFVSVVVEFGLIASQSDYAGTSSLAEAIARAEASHKDYADRQEFIALAKRLYG